MKVRLVALALTLAACGGEPTVQTTAGGDPGTKPAPTATPTPPPRSTESFRTPTGRFACTVLESGLTCDVRRRTGDMGFPVPDRDISKQCAEFAEGAWGDGVTLPYEDEAFPLCSTGVNVTDQDPPVLLYGDTWERDGFTCLSESKGLTCTRGDHGFFANRDVIQTH